MSTAGWVPVSREDREIVGYLEPVTEDYDLVQPRTLFGHPEGAVVDFLDGEEILLARGIGELAERWVLDPATRDEVRDLTIVELSPHGIELADHYETKAMAVGETVRIPWPDLAQRISRA